MISFAPIKKSSTNIMADLKLTAQTNNVNIDAIDFDLLSYETYFKSKNDTEWQQLSANNLLTQTTEADIRSYPFLVRQEYHINVRCYAPHDILDLRFSIGTNSSKTKAIAIIDPTSTIPLKKGVQKWIKDAIQRKQLRIGFMIGICDIELDKEINRLLANIQKNGPLTTTYHLPIAQCFTPTNVIHDKVIFHYQHENENNSYIQGVLPGDLILEYLFPKHGLNGLGCSGVQITIAEPMVKYADFVKIDPLTISVKEDQNSIRYYAMTSGYVRHEKDIFFISKELRLKSANMKTTGSIEPGRDKEIFLSIKQEISSEDAVGAGVNIDVQTVDILGTVGENTYIQAQDITIGAQTHKKSTIGVSDGAKIQLHRGNLKAKIANIDILEGGIVEADIVRINKMLGGEVIAREVSINILYSNATVTALESIEIQHIEGSGNKLIIDPDSIPVYHEKIAQLCNDIQAKRESIEAQTNAHIQRQQTFKKHNLRIKEMKNRIQSALNSQQKPMKADIIRVRLYKTEADNLGFETEKLREEAIYLNALNDKLDKLYDADLHAVVIYHGSYNGQNRITFIDPKTKEECIVSPKGNIRTVRLQKESERKVILLEP